MDRDFADSLDSHIFGDHAEDVEDMGQEGDDYDASFLAEAEAEALAWIDHMNEMDADEARYDRRYGDD